MSNFRAIATVTATLQRSLENAIQVDVPGATVTAVRPADAPSNELPTTGVNIFLYRVTPNPQWRNADLPTRRADGEVAQRPVAALDLHYLLSFYGAEATLEPQRLLGSTVAFMHSEPLLTRARILATIADPAKTFLANSDLGEDIDLVRFVPSTLSLEEVSRLWSVLLQIKYVLSAVYQASVLLVERQVTPRPALPTRAVNLGAVPLRQPYIGRVLSSASEGAPITPGSSIVVEGLELRGDVTVIEVDGAQIAATAVGPQQIDLTLPSALRAGPHAIQVRHAVRVGRAGPPRLAFASNLGSFVVQPVITKTAGAYDINITDVQGTGAEPRSATVTVHLDPPVGPHQTTTLELLRGAEVAHTVRERPATGDLATAVFSVVAVAAGEYLIRVRVDGAETPLDLDANRVPIAPKGTIT